MHAGIDLAAPTGTPIHATADGIVSRADVALSYANLVQLDHGASVQTRYGHLSQILVKSGQRVHRGDVIALVGSTGRSTGSHLHYELRVADRAIDPLPFMARDDEQLALQQAVGPTAESSTALGGPSSGDD
jgi:murein DD-endopeptidase MepM/ murein hydrolase activator NlpD